MTNLNFNIDYYRVDSLALTVKDFKGDFNRKCTVIVLESDQIEENELLLSNILKAINLDIGADIHLGYLAEGQEYHLLEYLKAESPNLILVFGMEAEMLCLHMDYTQYTPLNVYSTHWIFSHSLSVLTENKLYKKRLWEALKQVGPI